MNLKIEQLKNLFPAINNDIVTYINADAEKYEVNTLPRIQQFLAQVGHESIGLTVFKENLNYSESGLLTIFHKYFTASLAKEYARRPEKIANRVYANRNGNGDTASGDGWKYRGRGAIQITGKSNYTKIGEILKINLVNSPELLEQPQYAIESAFAWWTYVGKLNPLADKNSQEGFISITKIINGGTNGLEDRIQIWNNAKKIIN